MKNKLSTASLYLLIVISVAVITIGYLLIFHQNPPVEFYNLPFPTDKQTYSAGDDVLITVELCRNTLAPFDLDLNFVDGLIYSTPGQSFSGAPLGCMTLVTNAAEIPKNLPPGEYYITAKNEYKVNFLATRLVEWSTTKFEVIP